MQRDFNYAQRRISSHAEFCKVLRRAGYLTRHVQSVVRDLLDPIDFDRDGGGTLRNGYLAEPAYRCDGRQPVGTRRSELSGHAET